MTGPAAKTPTPISSAPPSLAAAPRPRIFEPPVTWLLGRQLVAGLKWIALYTGFRSKLDARDWMQAEVFPDGASGASPWQEEDGAFWFDYIADCGDGARATYSIACLCLSDLWSKTSPDPTRPVEPIAFASGDPRLDGAATKRLPRGQFLFVGGDTSYHIADYWTLIERFKDPLTWAHEDLQATQRSARVRRPIFGLPGNHDYYDFLDGFGRQFRRPSSPEAQPNALGLLPQLDLPGFRRCQNASYVAIAMPYRWWLWGIDCENGRVDVRQQDFFRRINGGGPPAKLVVATPEPTTVCGRRAKSHDKIPAVFRRLFPSANGRREPFLADGQLAAQRCRLDLSGDHHKYERYWGIGGEAGTRPPAPNERVNYASVVAGLGGAFLHPSETDAGQVQRRMVYPTPERSRNAVAAQIFRPRFIAHDSFVRPIAAGLVALTCVGFLGRSVFEKGSQLLALVASWPPRFDIMAMVLAVIAGLLALRTGRRFIDGRYRAGVDGRSRDRRWVRIYGAAALLLSGIGIGAVLLDGPVSSVEASVAITLAACAGVVAASGVAMYAEWVARQVRTRGAGAARWYYWVVLTLSAVAAAVLAAALFGARAKPAGDLMTDLTAMLVLIVGGGGALVMGWAAGRELHGRAGAAGIAALGLFHFLVQLGIPLLVAGMTPVRGVAAVAIALIAVLAAAPVGRALLRGDHRVALLATFVLLTVMVAALPVHDLAQGLLAQSDGPKLGPDPLWIGLLRMATAVGFAFAIAPVWLGWYLAVALAFNAHNNEAAGAVRIEQFKQMIRFRVTDKSITGYVIAIDQPRHQWQLLEPRLVDVFTVYAT